VAAERGDSERDSEVLIAEFLEERERGLRFISGLDVAACAGTGFHPVVGELSAWDLLHEWIYHDREHLAQILRVTRSLVWPAMGNARRFSDPSG
jgi:hypothetical protein